MLDPVGEWRVRDETEVDRRRAVRVLDVDLVSAEAQRSPAAPERLDLHAEYTLVKCARLVHVADGQDEMVEAVEIEVWHASDSIPLSSLHSVARRSTARAQPPLVEPSRVQLDHVAVSNRMSPADVLAVDAPLARHARVHGRPRCDLGD